MSKRLMAGDFRKKVNKYMDGFGTKDDANSLKALILQNRREADEAAETIAAKRKVIDEAIATIEKQFESDNFNLILQHREATEAAASYDQQLRELTIQYFKETGEKRLDADCSVRVATKYQYENKDAIEWAEANAPVLIVKTVDKKSFESLPHIELLPWVSKIETPTAVIAKEFTEWMNAA